MGEKKRPILSISMLVSNNRRDTIEKCMESLVPLREAVSSELIVVDTGCTDGSVDIARKYADKVVQFTWCNDFSAARNAGLRECTGEWFLYLDDDEWFEDVSELVTFFQGEEKKHCDTLWYIQRNYDNMEGTVYTDTRVGRAVKMTPETSFHGKIHEWLEPLPKMIKKVGSYVHHYGYVYKCEEDRLKHLERNLTLEEEAVKENPNDIRMCCQLVQEYRVARRYEDAEALCKSTLERTQYLANNSFVQYLFVVLPKIYNEQGKTEKALEEYERLEREVSLLHQSKLEIYCEKANLLGRLERPAEVLRECKRYFKEYDTIPKVGEPVEYPVMDFEHYRSEFCRQKVVKFGITAVLKCEDYSYAEELFDRMDWNYDKKNTSECLIALLKCYIETGNVSLLKKHLPKILQIEELETQVYATLHSAYEKYPEKHEMFLADLESLNLRSGNFAFFHLLYTEKKGITTVQDLEEYYEKSDRKYDAEVVGLLFQNAKLFPRILERTSFELYKEAVSVLVAEKDMLAIDVLWEGLHACKAYYSEVKMSFLHYAAMVIAEKRLVLGVVQQTKARELLEDYMVAVRKYAEEIYRPELLNVTCAAVLPANIRFVCIMEQALAAEADITAWGDGIKRAAKEYPVMLPVVKELLEERKKAGQGVEKEKMQGNSAQEELLALAEQLKAMVRAQLAEGKTEEAKAILSELAVMLPEDEEVKEMLQKMK